LLQSASKSEETPEVNIIDLQMIFNAATGRGCRF
jgi:hypothetical protein